MKNQIVWIYVFIGVCLIVGLFVFEKWGPGFGLTEVALEYNPLDWFDSGPIPSLETYDTITGEDFQSRRSRGGIIFSHNTDDNQSEAYRSSVTIGAEFPSAFYDVVLKGMRKHHFKSSTIQSMEKQQRIGGIVAVGSGFALSGSPGKIFTAAHVVKPPTHYLGIEIPPESWKGTKYYFHACKSSTSGQRKSHWVPLKGTAKLDWTHDVAMLSIADTRRSVKGLSPYDGGLYPGMPIYAIGTPMGKMNLRCSITTGIISHVRRHARPHGSGRSLSDVIQFDAVIERGNSGGPLIDRHGDLVGVVVSGISARGFGIHYNFAVPVKYVRDLVKSGAKEISIPFRFHSIPRALESLSKGHSYFEQEMYAEAARAYYLAEVWQREGDVRAVAALWRGLAEKRSDATSEKDARRIAVNGLGKTDSRPLRNLMRHTIREWF